METPSTPETAATVTIEAATVEEALARLSEEIGQNARILSAERVRRGGIAGFFSRELVELVAEVPTEPSTNGVDNAFARLLADAEEAESGHVPHTPQASGPVVAWDASRLLDLGLPERVVSAIAGLDPGDDIAHLAALADLVAPVCGEVGPGPHRLVGGRIQRLQDAAAITAGDGPLHLVMGDDPLPERLAGAPQIVSWVSDRAAPRAIALALGTGATLGWAMASAFGAPARRVTAVDAAIALRELMERR